MKAVPSILHYLGKCTAGFSSNCVHNLLNSATIEGWHPAKLDKCVAVFSVQTSLNYGGSTPVCETARKVTKVGCWLQSSSYAKLD